MATPKKKHLIELMIEAGVKWPEGAEYAAQDKRDNKVYFFCNKPTAQPRSGRFVAHEGATKNYLLPSICRNWHQTIVTRERYTEALADAESLAAWMDISHLDAQSNQAHESDGIPSASAAEWHNPPPIEQLTADYHAKAAEADRLQAVAYEALKAADDALLALEKAGELIGLVISIDTKSKQEEPQTITDWRDLRVGDVIWVSESQDASNAPSGEYSITDTDFDDNSQPVEVEWSGGKTWPNLTKRHWCFIRRP